MAAKDLSSLKRGHFYAALIWVKRFNGRHTPPPAIPAAFACRSGRRDEILRFPGRSPAGNALKIPVSAGMGRFCAMTVEDARIKFFFYYQVNRRLLFDS